MTDEELTLAMAELQEVVRCRCDEAYRDRGLKDPHCECDSADAVKVVADRIEALTAKLARAEAGLLAIAKRVELYRRATSPAPPSQRSKERAMSEPSGTDARLDRIEALTEQLAAARQDAKFAEDELEMQEQEACMMENDYLKLEKERDALEAKLAKAVEALGRIQDGSYGRAAAISRTTLAEIKGESHE